MSVARARVLNWKPRPAAAPVSDREPWLTMDQAGAHLGYAATKFRGEVARQFCRRHGIRLRRRGGKVLLVKQAALDHFLETGRAPKD